MGNEDGSEDRLTKNEFGELIQHLSVQEILTIEYRIGSIWNKLFLRKNAHTLNFFCNLCLLETSSFKNLLAHIDGRKHKLQMEKVDQLYQLDYTYPKSYKSESYIDGKKLNNVEDNKACVTMKKKTVDVRNKNNAHLKSSAEIEKQNKIRDCEKKIKSKNKEDNATSQEYMDRHVKKVEEVHSKQDMTAGKVNVIVKEARKSAQKLPKRFFIESCSDEDINLKKSKIVVNPAAAFYSKAKRAKAFEHEKNNKKPEYQTERIIIPTAHKNKSFDQTSSLGLEMQANVGQKLYSSKPCDNNVIGILGVEYVIKILKNRNDISPRYECGLCELVLDGLAMQRHLEGYNHRLKFCEKHFPTAIRQYRQYMKNLPEPEIFKVMNLVLAKLAQAIEQHHGRNSPYECFERDYSLNRYEILANAFSCRHASEQYGPTFTHVVGSKDIEQFINNRQKYLPPLFSRTAIFDTKTSGINNKFSHRNQNCKNDDREFLFRERIHHHAGHENVLLDGSTYQSHVSSGLQNDVYSPYKSYMQADDRNDVQPVDDETYNLMVDDFLKGTLKGVSRRNSFYNTRKCSSPPVHNLSSETRKSLSPLRQDDIWQAYRHLVDQELYNLEERFKEYRKEPESHPSYNEEWQKFWKRRKDELVSAGVDHRNYNYQPEWVRFVKFRIEELYSQEIETLKIKSRERFCLPMSNEKVGDTKYHVKSQQTSLSNEITETEYNMQQNAGAACSKTSQTRNSSTPQVVSVLRLMTALEDSLGSLGPKIIDLLSKALQTEKVNPLHVNAIILNDDNCSLIETAKEKLKGLVISGLFEGPKKKVLRQVVTNAETLLNYAYQFKKEFSSQCSPTQSSIKVVQNNSSFSFDNNASNTLKNQPAASNFFIKRTQSSFPDNLLPRIDKKELASKLAASLVAQGKTEFDPSQLQQIIAVYKLIEKKKRETTGSVSSSNLQDSSSVSKKTLSDTLTDLLKLPSSSGYVTSDVRNITKTSNSTTAPSNFHFCSSAVSEIFANTAPTNSSTRSVQNPRDNFFNNTARSCNNAYGANNVECNLIEQRNDYAKKYSNNLQPNQPSSTFSNMRNNQFQNSSRMTPNWEWNTNLNANENYNMNNHLDQNSNWQNF